MTHGGKGMSLHTKILLALILGAAAGVAVNLWGPGSSTSEPTWVDLLIQYVMTPVGQVFLRLLFLTVIPLVFASLALGVAQLGQGGNLGRIGLKTFAYFVVSMAAAVVIGLLLVNLIQPGSGLPAETKDRLMKEFGGEASARTAQPTGFGIDTFINIVPRNPLKAMVDMDMLAVIFFALLIGIGLTKIPADRARSAVTLLEAINDLMVVIIGWAMLLAPFGVFALIFSVTARFGFEMLRPLGLYIVVVLVGLAIQMVGTLSVLLAVLGRVSPLKFFRRANQVLVTAFSTSSSSATLPTSIKTAEEEMGVPPPIAGFVLPLGATMNMNGTALFEGVTVVFLAQVFGVELTLAQQLIVVVLAVMTAIGAAGVPGGSLPLLVMVMATVGVPEMGIALILGVDRLLDMCRTTLNVIGDLSAAVVVARSEGYKVLQEAPAG